MINNQEEFKREYLCEWVNNETYNKAYNLRIWYEYQCEMYDRCICTGKFDEHGFITPSCGQEHNLINANALYLRKIILNEAHKYGISSDIWDNVRHDIAHLSWTGIKQQYDYIQSNNIQIFWQNTN